MIVVIPAVAAAFHAVTSRIAPEGIAERIAATAVQNVRRAKSVQLIAVCFTVALLFDVVGGHNHADQKTETETASETENHLRASERRSVNIAN